MEDFDDKAISLPRRGLAATAHLALVHHGADKRGYVSAMVPGGPDCARVAVTEVIFSPPHWSTGATVNPTAATQPVTGGERPAAPGRWAILVIHGMGPQQRFEPLDRFVNGLRATLQGHHKSVRRTHRLFGTEKVFDHCFEIKVSESDDAAPNLQLDIYEFYWAPLPQGKASFTQVVSWLVVTGFTPLRRFAFNVPLMIRRGETLRGLCREFACEIWRFAWVSLSAVALAGLAVALVAQAGTYAKQICWAKIPAAINTLDGAATAAIALVAAVVAIGLGFSIPGQIEDFIRLKKVEPLVLDETARAWGSASGDNFITRLRKSIQAAWNAVKDRPPWLKELRARIRLILPVSCIAFVVASLTVFWLCVAPICIGPLCPALDFHRLLTQVVTGELVVGGGLLGIAFVLKRIFVDYFASVALYTTADENSTFFATRAAILKEAVGRIRFLLKDCQYTSVAIAGGHSLGSVIGYDAINRLRTDARLPNVAISRDALHELANLTEKVPAADVNAAKKCIDQLEKAIARVEEVPVSTAEFAKLKAFITFGSPLNKVQYFFRTKVKPYETVRAHILGELNGFRQPLALLTRDPTIEDASLSSIPDNLTWMNASSLMDPVSARLAFFDKVKEYRYWYWRLHRAHVSYWDDWKFYRDVLTTLGYTWGLQKTAAAMRHTAEK